MPQLQDTFEVIPDELRARPQWMAWQSPPTGNTNRRTLVSAHVGWGSSHTDQRSWASFAEAATKARELQAQLSNPSSPTDDICYAGLAYILTPQDPYVIIELNQCRDQPWALEVIAAFDSYTEHSPSGNGYRIIIRAEKPKGMANSSNKLHDRKLKLHASKGVIHLTGNRVEGTPPAILERQSALEDTCQPLLKRKPTTTTPPSSPTPDDDSAPSLEEQASQRLADSDAARKRQEYNTPLPNPETVFDPVTSIWGTDDDGNRKFKRPKGTVENLQRMLDAYGISVRYNDITRYEEVWRDGQPPPEDANLNVELVALKDIAIINNYPAANVMERREALGYDNRYNPVLDWVTSKEWDGGQHILDLFETLTLADNSEANRKWAWKLFRKWLLGAVALGTGRIEKFEFALVLVDPTGGLGKTSWFQKLCPLKSLQFSGDIIDPHNKDDMFRVMSKWLVELGEIDATFSASDIESLKAMLSREKDELRRPYAAHSRIYPRRTAFFGSVNSIEFLRDTTNNRRFWPIHVTAVNYAHSIDMQQVWAEALYHFDSGLETHYLDQSENQAIGDYNEQFREWTPSEELILAMLDPKKLKKTGEQARSMTAVQILHELGQRNPGQKDKARAGKILTKHFHKRTIRGTAFYTVPTPDYPQRSAVDAFASSTAANSDYAATKDPTF